MYSFKRMKYKNNLKCVVCGKELGYSLHHTLSKCGDCNEKSTVGKTTRRPILSDRRTDRVAMELSNDSADTEQGLPRDNGLVSRHSGSCSEEGHSEGDTE